MLEAGDLQCLKAIALMGGCRGPVWISSQSFGDSLSMSPQTASRRLKSLEGQRLIDRSLRPDGQYVTVTSEGEGALREEYAGYCQIFGGQGGPYSLTGSVISGLGEGRYYMSLPTYREQFRKILGKDPFPGTLNLRLSSASRDVKRKVDGLAWTRIQDIPCAIVVPGRSHYPDDVIELISPVELRAVLDLSDGDLVTVEVANA